MSDQINSQVPQFAKLPWSDSEQIFKSGRQAFAQWIASVSAMSEEVVHFTQERLQQHMEACTALATCKSPQEALDCQCRFASKAVDDYFAELGKLPRLMMDLGTSESHPQRAGKRSSH